MLTLSYVAKEGWLNPRRVERLLKAAGLDYLLYVRHILTWIQSDDIEYDSSDHRDWEKFFYICAELNYADVRFSIEPNIFKVYDRSTGDLLFYASFDPLTGLYFFEIPADEKIIRRLTGRAKIAVYHLGNVPQEAPNEYFATHTRPDHS